MLPEVNSQTLGDFGVLHFIDCHQEGQGYDLSPKNHDQGVLGERRQNNSVLEQQGLIN